MNSVLSWHTGVADKESYFDLLERRELYDGGGGRAEGAVVGLPSDAVGAGPAEQGEVVAQV